MRHKETQGQAHTPLSCDVCAIPWVLLCYSFVSSSAWLYPLTPFVIMDRKSSREKSDRRNTSSGLMPN